MKIEKQVKKKNPKIKSWIVASKDVQNQHLRIVTSDVSRKGNRSME